MSRLTGRGLVLLLAVACTSEVDFDPGLASFDNEESLSGGRTGTVLNDSRNAFGQVFPGLRGARAEEFFVGNAIFNRGWVSAPASVADFDGLGPLYNATNCSACHFKDGRGAPPLKEGESFLSLLIRLSVPGAGPHGEPLDEPVYGGQIQSNGILGVPAEAAEVVAYSPVPGRFADGTTYELQRPTYSLRNLGYGPLQSDTMLSPRVAPAVYGLGLLEAISESTLRALEDINDRNGDGISGKLNWVYSPSLSAMTVGRFGWKAGAATVRDQSAGAFRGDLGITSALVPSDDCTVAQASCTKAPNGAGGGSSELAPALLESVSIYQQYLAVPVRRDWDTPEVRAGRAGFMSLGCNACHVMKLTTGSLAGDPERTAQVIRPFTDLLLHDMGDGLADGRPEYRANGNEWRTPPLWGVGLVPVVNRHTRFLHDGRARNLEEAILWHGGEAERAKEMFRSQNKRDREALLKFLESL
jgi:CxxC motif-containing protein (DUF1111 family)